MNTRNSFWMTSQTFLFFSFFLLCVFFLFSKQNVWGRKKRKRAWWSSLRNQTSTKYVCKDELNNRLDLFRPFLQKCFLFLLLFAAPASFSFILPKKHKFIYFCFLFQSAHEFIWHSAFYSTNILTQFLSLPTEFLLFLITCKWFLEIHRFFFPCPLESFLNQHSLVISSPITGVIIMNAEQSKSLLSSGHLSADPYINNCYSEMCMSTTQVGKLLFKNY